VEILYKVPKVVFLLSFWGIQALAGSAGGPKVELCLDSCNDILWRQTFAQVSQLPPQEAHANTEETGCEPLAKSEIKKLAINLSSFLGQNEFSLSELTLVSRSQESWWNRSSFYTYQAVVQFNKNGEVTESTLETKVARDDFKGKHCFVDQK